MDVGTDEPWSASDQRSVGIAAVATAQALDLATTLYGLRSPGIVELNPAVAAVMGHLGEVPGLLCAGLFAVVAVVAVTETAARRCEGTLLGPAHVRCVGYVPPATLSVMAALYNLYVVGVL